jgi:hypothetical protein
VSSEDQRFQGQIKDKATIVDTPRNELRKVANMQVGDHKKERRGLASSNTKEKANNKEPTQNGISASSVQNFNEYSPQYLKYILVVCVCLGVVYVFWKIKTNRK